MNTLERACPRCFFEGSADAEETNLACPSCAFQWEVDAGGRVSIDASCSQTSERTAVTPELNEALRALLASTCDILVACEYLSAASYVRIAIENAIPRPSIKRYLNGLELTTAIAGLLQAASEVARTS